jgi:predicted RNA binding protein YcfA (HicA-like mRNA interferase family)
MPKRYSTKDIEKVLLARGFSRVSQRGSHVKFTDGLHTVILPAGRDVVRAGTFASILRQSGLSASDFEDAQA